MNNGLGLESERVRKRLKTSIFEIFKIGVGPSSSHTVGPMRAARRFALDLEERGWLETSGFVATPTIGEKAGPSTPVPRSSGVASLRMTPNKLSRVRTELFGSLALTGHGHATDR